MTDKVLVLPFWGLFAIVLIMLILSFRSNRARLLNGILGNLAVIIFIVALFVTQTQVNNSYILRFLIIVVAGLAIVGLVVYSLAGILLLWNALLVWRRESHQLANMLTLILGIALLSSSTIFSLINHYFPNRLASMIANVSAVVVMYMVVWFANFAMSYLLSRMVRHKLNKQFVIILGAGLMGEKVSPLLAGRLDRAIKFRNKQLAKTGNAPVLIPSGGQGGDEVVPEGVAMRNYLLEQGIPASEIHAETKSKNTYENMEFSKQIVDELGFDRNLGLFATSDYHTFRAAGFARYVGMPIDGLGAKTSRFFVPNAILREYVAILMAHKKFHAIVLSLLVIAAIVVSFIPTN